MNKIYLKNGYFRFTKKCFFFQEFKRLPACRRLLFPLFHATKEIGDVCTQANVCQIFIGYLHKKQIFVLSSKIDQVVVFYHYQKCATMLCFSINGVNINNTLCDVNRNFLKQSSLASCYSIYFTCH